MPDILLTTPKKELKNSKEEWEDVRKYGGHRFRMFRFKPNVRPGDKVFHVEDGKIVGYSTVTKICKADESQQCHTTGRIWGKKGDWMMQHTNFRKLKKPIKHKGFQGIRYVERLSEKIKKRLKV